jgi:hypothetical protein
MEKKTKKKKIDGQLIGLAGRNWLISRLFQGGIEVARPERDRGVDLIAYIHPPKFIACPIQVKSSLKPQFTVYDKEYNGMLLVFVWHVDDSTKTVAYALTSTDAPEWLRNMDGRRKGLGTNLDTGASGNPAVSFSSCFNVTR